MVSRIYVEKKPGFDVEAQQLAHELRSILGITSLEGLRLVNRYDVEGISQELFDQCVPTVFSGSRSMSPRPSCPRPTARRCSPWSSCPASSTSVRLRQASASS